MSEIMTPMPFSQLMSWSAAEYQQHGRIFGIRKEKFYKNASGKTMGIFGNQIASPIGPAAGPNSQLAQNIVAAYLVGSRFIELKTVQKMDGADLRACVPRPCINAEDECYNVEWSTELTVPQAMNEYIKAWVAIHILSKELGLAKETDVVFNMSVGYDYDGICEPKIDGYINGMVNAANTDAFKESLAWLRENKAMFPKITDDDINSIPTQVSNSVTLSTLHGCPPKEIERIARHLLEVKGVNTFVKCNPTLLGYETARSLLDKMGFEYVNFTDHHFKEDLQFDDAVEMIKRLMALGKDKNLAFGVKITNTFPVLIKRKELPGEEMYMSGRPLFPLSLTVANRLSKAFDGKLPISYSGGADAFNIDELYKLGIRPITVATTILKPGGYERMHQLAQMLEPLMTPEWNGVDVAAIDEYTTNVFTKTFYHKEHRPVASRKTESKLPLFDCFKAPCKDGGCPIEQQIPEYLRLVSKGEFAKAFEIIAIDNANPSITGTICNHACQGKCTRLDYDESVHIRHAKLIASNAAQDAYIKSLSAPAIKTDKKAVVIGAGPAGVSAALFLRRAGVSVTVLEKRAKPFGIVEYVIPAFRIPEEAMKRDFEMAEKMGVDFKFNVEASDISSLKKDYNYVIVAVGAWKEGAAPVQQGEQHLLGALAFLEESKAKNCKVSLGKNVAVIGGGDVAMDCARAAKRAPGTENVTIVYRRTKDFMPAEPEEIRLAIEDGVEINELRSPKEYDGSCLLCEETCLSDWDESGRRGITGTGKEHKLIFDSVICAVGARVDSSLYEANNIKLDERARPVLSAANETNIEGVYIAGDCRRGASTVVAAIADAKTAAKDICAKLGLENGFTRSSVEVDADTLYDRKGILRAATDDATDASRCLACDQLCELCCDVCPNRANVRILMPDFGKNASQILHIDGMCNECGNCGVFCPHVGNPYKDKVTVFWSEEDFKDSENKGFLKLGDDKYMLRLEDGKEITCALSDSKVPEQLAAFIKTVVNNYSYYLN